MIPGAIIRDVAAVMRQAEAEGWFFVGTAGLTDEELIESIAVRVVALKARGYGNG